MFGWTCQKDATFCRLFLSIYLDKVKGEIGLKIKRLRDCTLIEALEAWNTGFEGYFFDMTMDIDRFTSRFAHEGLSPDLSIVAFEGDKPVGIVVSGVRMIGGKKTAWNGGTGVAKSLRGRGIGKILIEEALEIYRNEGVERAVLEAVSENKAAITLYEKSGYHIKERLASLHYPSADHHDQIPFSDREHNVETYTYKYGLAGEAAALPIYSPSYPWQNQWQSLQNGGSLLTIHKDDDGTPEGYLLYKSTYDAKGQINAIVLYQGETGAVAEDEGRQRRNLYSGLHAIFSRGGSGVRRMAINVPQSRKLLMQLLLDQGFVPFVEQVSMEMDMS